MRAGIIDSSWQHILKRGKKAGAEVAQQPARS
jgi:hypothetical protein